MEGNKALEILKALRQTFNTLTAPAPVAPVAPAPAAFTDATLQDGTPVKITNLQPGGTVTIVGADGSEAPAPAGEHCLSDGTCIVVAEGGIISEVKPATAPMAPAEPDMAAQISQFEQRLAAMEGRYTEFKQDFEDAGKTTDQKFGLVVELCEELAKEPTAAPDPSAARRPVFVEPTTANEKFAKIANTLFSKKK